MLDFIYKYISPQTLAWLIIALPLAGAFINGLRSLFAARFDSEPIHPLTSLIGCGMPILSFIFSLLIFFTLIGFDAGQEATMITGPLFQWAATSNLTIDLGLKFDQLSLVMVLVVTGVGSLIHIYSMGYMEHDEGYTRYFSYLNLFLTFMLLLILADNLVLMFVGWEGVGLCSYLLIGFWFEDPAKAAAGKKAFIVNRIGDAGFLLGMFLIYVTLLSQSSTTVAEHGYRFFNFDVLKNYSAFFIPVATPICLLLFVGACGKSAQIPLYVWLPDAMAGPTPVSALIHAATMVTAGIYMIARLNFIFVLSPTALSVVAWTGAITAIFAATIALVQTDIKKVLAYSTISQLGYMFLGLGVGAFSASIFHLMTHAFFKALLFLGAGSVIHGMGGEQDIRNFGGLKDKMPVTAWTFVIGAAAIAGIFPFAGFFSKDAILWHTFHSGHTGLWVIGFVGAGLTAFYMFRLVGMTFFGNPEMGPSKWNKVHESPPSMASVLIILAILSTIGGWIGVPEAFGGSDHFHYWLSGVFGKSVVHEGMEESHAPEIILTVLSLLWALHWAVLSSVIYSQRKEWPAKMAERFKFVYNLLLNKYWIDEVYGFVIVRPMLWISRNILWDVVDAKLIDGYGVHGTGRMMLFWNRLVTSLQTGVVQQYLFFFVVGVALLLWKFAF
ncbi:MAG: NADH-quinone oxidoreductase subunit L [Deltaproteobacteria bacterium]|nr:NADH-quinone oxidoreductase subunit L [Deltaproteobacteria bacterium]